MGGERFEFNIGGVLNRMALVDYEKSGIGRNFLAGTYFLRDLARIPDRPGAESAMPIRVRRHRDFVNLAGKHRLHILFKKVAYA